MVARPRARPQRHPTRLRGAGRLTFLAMVGVLLCTAPAGAYVRSRTTKKGLPVFWNRDALTVRVYVGRPSAPLTSEVIQRAALGAAAAWSRRNVPCTAMDVRTVIDPGADAKPDADGTSRLMFRRREDCAIPRKTRDLCDEEQTLALTTVFARLSDGKVIDADVEVNAVFFEWTDTTVDATSPVAQDLQNALTHEYGHLLGFDHSCLLSLPERIPTDDSGLLVPVCGDATIQNKESTMYPAVDPGDTDRRSLAPDDVRGLCAIYPIFDPQLESQQLACGVIGRQVPGSVDESFLPGRRAGSALAPLAVVVALGIAVRRRRLRR
jgi:hypothetical protein